MGDTLYRQGNYESDGHDGALNYVVLQFTVSYTAQSIDLFICESDSTLVHAVNLHPDTEQSISQRNAMDVY